MTSAWPRVVSELQRGFRAFEFGRRGNQRPQRGGRSSLSPYHAAEIALGHEQLDERLPAMRALGDTHRFGSIRQDLCDDFDHVARAAHDAACSVATGAGAGILATSVLIVSDGLAPLFSQ